MDLKKLLRQHKKYIFSFEHKGWNIVVLLFTVLVGFLVQSLLDANMNPNAVRANVIQAKSTASEAYKISTDYDLVATESVKKSHYVSPGEIEKDVYSFGIQTYDATMILKDVTITKVGEIDSANFLGAYLFEGENQIAKAFVRDDSLIFSDFISVLQPDTFKEYAVKLDMKEDMKPGARFVFKINNPHDVSIYKDEEPIYSLGKYPIEGSYITVVGFR